MKQDQSLNGVRLTASGRRMSAGVFIDLDRFERLAIKAS
jgi:hypothetical protein